MFMRYVYTTAQDLEARSVAVVVEFRQRSKCFKLPVTDSISKRCSGIALKIPGKQVGKIIRWHQIKTNSYHIPR